MPRRGDRCASLRAAALPHSPPPSSPSSSSAPYVTPCECSGDGDGDGDGRHQSRNRAASLTLAQTSPRQTKDEATPSTDKSPTALSSISSFPYSATTSSMHRSSPQGATQEQTGARQSSQCTVYGSVPSCGAAACLQGDSHTSASAEVSGRRDLHALQIPSSTLAPTSFVPSASPPLTTSSQITGMPAPPPPPLLPPPPRTYYQYMHSFECRCLLSSKIRRLYGAGTVPIIVEPTESYLRLSPPPASPHSKAKSSTGSTGGAGGNARHGQLSTSDGASASVTVSSTASAFTSPSTKSTLKCVLPCSKSVAEVILALRGRLALDSCQSLFLSVGENNVLVPGNSLLGDLYERYRNPDGFLYLGYLLENTFGGDVRSTADEAAAIL